MMLRHAGEVGKFRDMIVRGHVKWFDTTKGYGFVVSEDGELLYRRILEHSHTDENGTSDADAPGNTFTRSGGPVDLGADTVVIVRAHMNNPDEYNGAAMRGSVAAGFEAASDLDPDFAAELENADPQPEACLF